MFSIGEFSKATGLTVKTLRFYHEQGILVPTHIDEQTGYRYYAESKLETARVIKALRSLEFAVSDIAGILGAYDDEAGLLTYLERHRKSIREKLQQYRQIDASLDQIISHEREAQQVMNEATFEIEEKTIEPLSMAGIRMKGKYSECGKAFGKLGRKFGRHLCGKPFLLHYDSEYKEDDADFEVCFPVRKGERTEEISVRELPGGACVSLLHKGPYDELGRSYARVFAYLKEHGYGPVLPTREVYIKGPGMIFKGNPKKYLTEIQVLIDRST